MRYSAAEKQEIIYLVDRSELGVNKTLHQLGIHKSTFYKWYRAYLDKGSNGLYPVRNTRQQWNSIPKEQNSWWWKLPWSIQNYHPGNWPAGSQMNKGSLSLKSSVYRILKTAGLITTPAHILLSASNEFRDKTCFVHQMWQTDFTYFKVLGWGWYYLSTILDDYSRFIIHWELCKTMCAEDVQRSVDHAMAKANLAKHQRPMLLSDNGACYIASELKEYLKAMGVKQVHGKLNHPQTQGKIERYHRSMKNVVKLDNYYSPDELTSALKKFVHYYNYQRYHESFNNVTPADVYFGKREQILRRREKIKRQSMLQRRKLYVIEKLKI